MSEEKRKEENGRGRKGREVSEEAREEGREVRGSKRGGKKCFISRDDVIMSHHTFQVPRRNDPSG